MIGADSEKKMLRVVHVIHSINPLKGGTSVALKSLVEPGEDSKLESVVITLDSPSAQWLAGWKVPVVAAGPARTSFGWTPRLREILVQEAKQSDAVVVHGLWQFHNVVARQVCDELGIPCLVYPHGMLDPWAFRQSLKTRLTKALAWALVVKPLLQKTNRICYTCDLEKEEAAKTLGKFVVPSAVIPLGVEGPADDIETLREAFFRRETGLSQKRIILLLGRLHPKKGCDLLIEGFARWRERMADGKSFHLRLTGPPHSEGYLEQLQVLAQKSGLVVGVDISFPGMMAGKLRWQELAGAEVMALPSHQENFGIVVGEALACGKPVLLSNRVNIWPWIVEAECGYVADDTVDGVCQLLTEWESCPQDELKQMSDRALALYESKFALSAQSALFEELIESLSPRRRQPETSPSPLPA